jgi:hypothetical protein
MRALARVALLMACSGCHLVTGIDDYDASLFVGEWTGVKALLGRKPTLTIFGDNTGDATVPVLDFDAMGGPVRVIDVGLNLDWQPTEDVDFFNVVATCGDTLCADGGFTSTLGCDVDNGGLNLDCTVLAGEPLSGDSAVAFRRSD